MIRVVEPSFRGQHHYSEPRRLESERLRVCSKETLTSTRKGAWTRIERLVKILPDLIIRMISIAILSNRVEVNVGLIAFRFRIRVC